MHAYYVPLGQELAPECEITALCLKESRENETTLK